MTEDSNRLIDRLVDGELSVDEQRRFLLHCEDNPSRWRDVALAYLEADIWRLELSDLARSRPARTATPPAPASDARPWAWTAFNVAAMLLLCLAVGYGIGSLDFAVPQPAANGLADKHEQPTENEINKDAQGPIYVLVQDREDDELQPMRVPLVNVEDLNAKNLADRRKSRRRFWSELRDHGHNVSHRRQWYPVRLKDGRSAYVPIDNVRVQFDGFQ